MAIIKIQIATEKDRMPDGVIRIPCKICKKSTLHDREVFDTFKQCWRKPIVNTGGSSYGSGYKKTWKCRECGKRTKF